MRQMMNKNIKIDMWYGDKFAAKKYRADAAFYPHGSFGYPYRGNIYNDKEKCIGDFAAMDSDIIEQNFIIKLR